MIVALGFFGFLGRKKYSTPKTNLNTSTPTISQGKLEQMVVYLFNDTSAIESDTIHSLISQIYGIRFEKKMSLTEELKDENIMVLDKIEVRFGQTLHQMEKKIEQLVQKSDVIVKADPVNVFYFDAPGRVDINFKLQQKIRGSLRSDTFTLKMKSDLGKDRDVYKIKEHKAQVLFFKNNESSTSDLNSLPDEKLELVEMKFIQ